MSGRWIQLLAFLQEIFQGAKSIVMQTSIVFRPKSQEEGVYDRKSDTHDVTDWSTDYMLCNSYCVMHRTDKIQVSMENCSVCASLTLQQFIYQQVYNPRDIHTPFSLLTRLQYSHLQIHCLNSWNFAMLCWHVECKLKLLLHKRLLTRYLPLNCYGSS